MPNTSSYRFTPDVPVYEVEGFFPGKEGLLINTVRQVKGLKVFGEQGGILTEEKLTNHIVDFLMSKKDENGQGMYEKYLIKKDKK